MFTDLHVKYTVGRHLVFFFTHLTYTPSSPTTTTLLLGGGADEAIANATKSIKKSLTYLEGKLKTTKFLVEGDHPTIAGMS